MANPKAKPQQTDEEDLCTYIVRLRDECDAWLTKRAEAEAAKYPNIPVGIHKQMMCAHAQHVYCPCAAVLMANPPDKDADA